MCAVGVKLFRLTVAFIPFFPQQLISQLLTAPEAKSSIFSRSTSALSILKKLAGQTAIYGLPTIIGRLLNYLLVPLYTIDNFSRAEYGTVNEMYAYVSFLNIILTYGMETALFNFSVQAQNKNKVYGTILTSVMTTSATFIALLVIFSQPIASVIRYPEHPEYIVWFALILGMDAVTAIAFAKLREQNKAKIFAAIKLLNILTNIFFNVFFLLFCRKVFATPGSAFYPFVEKVYSPETGVGYVFISNLIASAATLAVLAPSFFRMKMQFDFSLLKEMLPYSLPLLLAGLAGMTNETLDRIFLKYLLPENSALESVGVYGACYKLSLIMTIFIQAFRFAAEPFFFSHSVEKDARKLYARVMNYFVIVCMGIFLLTMLFLPWLKYFIGKNFWEGLAVVPILLLANFCLGVYFNLSVWYKLTNRTLFGAYISLGGAVVTIALNIALIPVMGYMGSAWATLICYALMMIASYIFGQRYYKVPYQPVKISIYAGFAVLLFVISAYVRSSFNISGGSLFGMNLTLLLLYGAVTWKMEGQHR